jgi:hypothetical protein
MNQDEIELDKEMKDILDKLRNVQADSKELILNAILEIQRKPIEEINSDSKVE